MDKETQCVCTPGYLKTVPGILKIVEMVCTLLVFVLVFSIPWTSGLGGWIIFSGIYSFVMITLYFILHITGLPQSFKTDYRKEFAGYCTMSVFLLISGAIAAYNGFDSQQVADSGKYDDSVNAALEQAVILISATAFFAFAAAILCIVDAVLQFRGRGQNSTPQTAVTTIPA